MIVTAESRVLPMREVLAHPLAPLPWSPANGDGSMHKIDKTALARNLEKSVSPSETILQPSACIIDGITLVHKLKGDGKTFVQHADSAFKLALQEDTDRARIDVAFDAYRETSIKNAERCNRSSTTGTQWKNIVLPLAHSGRTLHLATTFCSGRFFENSREKDQPNPISS